MFMGESNVLKGLALTAAVATTTGFAFQADAARILQSQTVYYQNAAQDVMADASSYAVRDLGNGSFLVNIANILRSTRTELTGVYFESGIADLISGGPTIQFMDKTPVPTNTFVSTTSSFSVTNETPDMPELIDWTGTALSVTAPGLGNGINNTQRMVMTFNYAEGVSFSDVEALIGGYGYRVASLVEDRNGVDFFSVSGPLSNPDALSGDGNITAVPTPSAFAAGLGLMALAGMKRRREEA